MSSPEIKIEETRSYKSIFKATTLFGGVQLYQILINVIRSKFVAVLLGTAGMGIQGLLQSTLQFVQSISSLGLSGSAVRDVSEANGSGNMEKISRTVTTLRRLVWFTGLAGMIAVMALSPVLSKLTFGSYDYTVPFILLSCILLLDQLASGQRVVLQGLRRLKDLARASAIGATVGLIATVPIYYAFGIKGIVPTLILNSAITLVVTWLFSRKVTVPKAEMTAQETWQEGKLMVKMGIAMSVSGIFECYDKPLEIFDYEKLKDEPLIDPDTIGLQGSPTNVYKSFSPPLKGGAMVLEGADKKTCEMTCHGAL